MFPIFCTQRRQIVIERSQKNKYFDPPFPLKTNLTQFIESVQKVYDIFIHTDYMYQLYILFRCLLIIVKKEEIIYVTK